MRHSKDLGHSLSWRRDGSNLGPTQGTEQEPRMTKWIARIAVAAGMIAAATSAQTSAYAQAEFYKDKTVTYIVATAPGGGYDTYGRLVAEYMQKYLPGSTFVVKNMPGAGH